MLLTARMRQKKTCRKDRLFKKAGSRTRTGDLNLGKVALYQLSYTRGRGILILEYAPCVNNIFMLFHKIFKCRLIKGKALLRIP